MDEIAACCSRLGIMVNGQMQCLGTVQHLKTKYAQGYTLAIKLKSNIPEESQNDLERLEKLIITKFSPCTLKDKHKVRLQFIMYFHLLIFKVLSMIGRLIMILISTILFANSDRFAVSHSERSVPVGHSFPSHGRSQNRIPNNYRGVFHNGD
jgi:hypothetical protein